MFNLGGMEILVILVVALLVLGPDKLPGFMRAAGKALGELRRVSTDLRDTMTTSITDDAPSSAKSTETEKPEPEQTAGAASSETSSPARPEQLETGQPGPYAQSGISGQPAAPYAHPCSSSPDADPAPLPPRKRPLPRAGRARRSRPQSAARTHSSGDAGDA